MDALLEVVEELSGIAQSKLVPTTVGLHSLDIGLPRAMRADTQLWIFELPSVDSKVLGTTIVSVSQYHRNLPLLGKCRNCNVKAGSAMKTPEQETPGTDESNDAAAKVQLKRCISCKQIGYCSQVRTVDTLPSFAQAD